jgi:type VI secretion system protein ImpM
VPRSALIPETGQPVAGFFGKLPSRGDFISRHLPKTFLDPWDTWLQTAIAQSRAQLGESWRESYCTSPIWRFALGAGLCGPTAHAGILMPSMDRVGRYYPLAITVPLQSDWPLFVLPSSQEAWFLHAERLALDALEHDELDMDDFSQQVAALGMPPPIDFPTPGTVAGNAWYCPLPEPLDLLQSSPVLVSYLLHRGFPQHSLWWTTGSNRINRCLLVCAGLPPVASFAALLDGNWSKWGWNEKWLAGIARYPSDPPAVEEDE